MKDHGGRRFGPVIIDDDQILFSLWAPSANKVRLVIEDGNSKEYPMLVSKEGCFELIYKGPVIKYRFKIDNQHLVPDPASHHQPDGVNGPSEVIYHQR